MKFIELINGKKERRYISYKRKTIIYKRDGGRCRYCRKKVKRNNFHADHINPVSYHGNDYVFNLCTACVTCNRRRSNNIKIQPRKISIFRKLYQFYLILKYGDFPSIEDFF